MGKKQIINKASSSREPVESTSIVSWDTAWHLRGRFQLNWELAVCVCMYICQQLFSTLAIFSCPALLGKTNISVPILPHPPPSFHHTTSSTGSSLYTIAFLQSSLSHIRHTHTHMHAHTQKKKKKNWAVLQHPARLTRTYAVSRTKELQKDNDCWWSFIYPHRQLLSVR